MWNQFQCFEEKNWRQGKLQNKLEERDLLWCCSQWGILLPFETSSEQNLQHPAIKKVLNYAIHKPKKNQLGC